MFARQINLPLIPVTISGTKDILPKHTMDLSPGRAYITIHEPIDPSCYDKYNIDEFINLVRNHIEHGLS